MNLRERWREGMSSSEPGLIFGLLQLVLGKQEVSVRTNQRVQPYEEHIQAYLGGNEGEDSI